MKSRGRFSADELRHIGLRIRAIRILTGLNQEEFSTKHGVPHISLKNWEQGRFTPRSESLTAYLKAIEGEGIQVDPEWVYFGSGVGPIYLNGSSKKREQMPSMVLKKHVEFFKEQQLSIGLNPVVSQVEDDSMMPDFKSGDVLGGVFLSRQEVFELSAIKREMQRPFLVLDSNGRYYPRHLFVNNERLFINSNDDRHLYEYTYASLAKICWYYSGATDLISCI